MLLFGMKNKRIKVDIKPCPKVYIAGKMTGLSPEEFMPLFQKASNKLKLWGFDVVNPCDISVSIMKRNNWNWDEAFLPEHREIFVLEDNKALLECNGIYLLTNYKNSPGALFELDLAQRSGMFVIYEEK